MFYLGDFKAGETICVPWSTVDKNGASCTVTDLVAGDIEIYKDGGVTQRASDSGVAVAVDFDSITGTHFITIDTSDNGDAGFYSAGSDYAVMLVGVTVDGVTVNTFLASFGIENRFAGSSLFETAAKMLVNKAIQDKVTGSIDYYDDDGQTVILTHTPADAESNITRTPS